MFCDIDKRSKFGWKLCESEIKYELGDTIQLSMFVTGDSIYGNVYGHSTKEISRKIQ
jgi:hypothetical protein